ncbi:cytochrome c [Vibrio sp. RM-44-3]|uniref:c-type cytochrome n=1 Tax=unclassified Vibrio TaxID=2614977 RepID=UPI00215C6BA7|nr:MULTISPECIES: cytochrome c [unclassified Vibrio]MCR9554140.1 cytochrome c [Vibrio sp. RM-41-2A]MCR9556405.1 cytochrome c [Vibrio sp. RM-41-2B]MCR9623632.1 cytochrome c [Vibrio sp. RM-44-3]
MFRFVLLTSLIFSSASHAAPFGDADKGKSVYCHGATGVAGNNAYPNLAGQNAQYLYDAMKSYQAGERKGPLAEMMGAQLRMLNDEDLRDVAAFYAEQTQDK